MSDLYRQWGANVAARRAERGWNQKAFADLLGTTQQSVSRWERGQVAPNDDTRVLIARTLEVDPAELFPYEVTAP